ncbi:MAG TPA: LamG-like jellyroll fold domain-containing protein [Solirubrobacteraceae bacterium]|nr:LamG-like jellyroll fold domain-containing protein [Solirubrobacteraceae bacterium]
MSGRTGRLACAALALAMLVAGVLGWVGLAGGAQPGESYEGVVSAAGPVAWFRFSDPAGSGTLEDAVGSHAYTAVNSGIVLGGAGPFMGSGSGAFGGEAFATLASDPLLDATAFTVEGWVDWAGGSSYGQPIFDFGSGSGDYMYLTPASSASKHRMLFELHTSAGTATVQAKKELPAGAWEYVAVSETSAGALTLYLNGEPDGSETASLSPASLGSSVPDVYLGKSLSGAASFQGSMSNVAFYTRALTGEQVREHYVVAESPVNVEAPSISGEAKEAGSLDASYGSWAGLEPFTYAYQWQRCQGTSCINIPKATGETYSPASADVDSTLQVVVTASNSVKKEGVTAASPPTATVEGKPVDTALPVISGEAKVGQLLTVSEGSWRAFPPASYDYLWESCLKKDCAGAEGADEASSYRVTGKELGDTLRAKLTATSTGFAPTSATSEATAKVVAGPPVNVEPPKITGEAREGQTLEASPGVWAGSEHIEYTDYAWRRCKGGSCHAIDGASGATATTYTLTSSDVGYTIEVEVTAKNSVESVAATSPETPEVIPLPPRNTQPPVVSGEAIDGQTLSASTGSWEGAPPLSYTYQWEECNDEGEGCSAIRSATSERYTLAHGDVGKRLRVVVTAENNGGPTSQPSQPTPVVQAQPPVNTQPPVITGEARDGQTLSASTGSWEGTPPLTYTYQWEECNEEGNGCHKAPDATSASYQVAAADVGKTLLVTVTAENAAGTRTASSKVTSPVSAAAPSNTEPPNISGTAQVGQTLTASAGSWQGSEPISFLYQWLRCTTGAIGSDGSGPGQFRHPGDVAVGANGDLWVVDQENARIQELGPQGEYLSQFGSEGSGDGQLLAPDAIAVAPNGEVWVADTGNDRIEEFTPAGEYLRQVGSYGSGAGQFAVPEGIAVDAHGDVWVSDTGNARLEEFSETGEYLRSVGSSGSEPGQIGEPEGLAIDSKGDVWVADWSNDRVEEFSETGEYLQQLGAKGAEAGQLEDPYGIAVSAKGDVFVGDVGNDRIDEFNEHGEYVRLFGTPGTGAGQLRLSFPMGLAVTSTGGIWVTDSANDRLEQFGELGEYLGTPVCAYITGANGPTYSPVDADVGRQLRVLVTAESAGGEATATSVSTSVVEAAPGEEPAEAPVPVIPPTITGSTTDGEVLVASQGVWTGSEPIFYSYQWERCSEQECKWIGEATEASYQPQESDVGSRLRVRVIAENVAGSASSISEVTAVVLAAPPANTQPPTISGEAIVGHPLTASAGTWSGTTPFGFAYQWERCDSSGASCANIPAATSSTYVLGEADVGGTVRVSVTATNSAGHASSTSAQTAVVLAPPANTELPSIAGESVEGQALRASPGHWTGTTPIEYRYQWERCEAGGEGCTQIAGATETEYGLGESEVGSILRVVVTATNAAGSASSTSVFAGVVQPQGVVSTEPPVIAGPAEEGQTLSASDGRWEGTRPIAVAYQWESCDSLGEGCMPIAGATSSSLLLQPADVGGTVRVLATATNSQGSASSVSAATGVVTAGGVYYLSQFGEAGAGAGQLRFPADVAVDADGDVWVADAGNNRIEEFSPTGEYLRQLGTAGSGEGQLQDPTALALDSAGDVWVADAGNHRVDEFSEHGEYIRSLGTLGTGEGQLEYLGGIALNGHGDVWVSDTSNGRLEEFSPEGEHLASIGGGLESPLHQPKGLAVSPNGDIWVADNGNASIDEFSEAGELLLQFHPSEGGATEGGSSSPGGLALDGDGDVWVTDRFTDRVKEFNEHGQYVTEFGSEGSGMGQFEFETDGERASGLAISSDGDIFVTDTENNRVEEWKTSPPAPANTSLPVVTGATVAGLTLGASEGAWSGEPVRYEYQWQRCSATGAQCAEIAGASSATYSLTNQDVGATLEVVVTAFGPGGATSAASVPTVVIEAATPLSNTVSPVISGTAEDGKTLIASTGAWSGTTPSSYAYQWTSCNASGSECAPLEDATGPEYTLGDGDVGSTLRVTVTATNDAGSAQASSSPSAEVQAEAPQELEAPTVSGVPDANEILHAGHGAWTGTERHFSYQWESCNAAGEECAPIEGATGSEYDLGEGDVSTTVRVRVGMHSLAGSLSDVSAVTPVIGEAGALASSVAPTISGTPQEGQTLTASPGSWLDKPSYAYQWQRCNRLGLQCTSITGATAATYTVAASEVGETLRVRVKATLEHESSSRVSATTQPLAAAGAPAVQQRPRIEGAALEGQTLTATTGGWSGAAPSSYTYQWERCASGQECEAIAGASASSYTLGEGDVSSTILVLVTATGTGGSSIGVSVATATVAPEALAELAAPSVAGTVQVGGELAAEPGIWSGAGDVSLAYAWERCNRSGGECTPIAGADTSAYLLASGAVPTLRVKVTANSPLGSLSAVSPATVATPGGEVTVEQAEEATELTDGAVLAPSTNASLEGQTVAPRLEDEEELAGVQTLTSSSVSKENSGEFAVNTPDGEVSITPSETLPTASKVPTLVNGTAALFANTAPATDTIVRPDALGATSILQLRSAEAPQSFTWEVGLGPNQQLEQLPDGSVAVTDVPELGHEPNVEGNELNVRVEPLATRLAPAPPESTAEQEEREQEEREPETEEPLEQLPPAPTSSTPPAEAPPGELTPQNTREQYEAATSAMAVAENAAAGTVLMVIEPPLAVDAAGHSVPASLTVAGDIVKLHLHPSNTTRFPVLAALTVAAPSNTASAERDPFVYGLSDQEASDISDPAAGRLEESSAPLHIQSARVIVPWDVVSDHDEEARLNEWLSAVEAHGLQPYVTFEASTIRPTPSVHEYRQAVKEAIERYKAQVGLWGAWNEPDLGENFVRGERAGRFWQAAESVAIETGCPCTIVAGEFSSYPAGSGFSVSRYLKGLRGYSVAAWDNNPKGRILQKAHRLPSTWGLHDYEDVVSFSDQHAREFLAFAGGRLKNPQVWISEAGVELHNGVEGDPPVASVVRENDEPFEYYAQTAAAETFLGLRDTGSRIHRVYYYSLRAPAESKVQHKPNEFDSGLLEAEPESAKPASHGEPRPAYCYLAYEKHACPPTLVVGNGAYMVNTFGTSGTVTFNVQVEDGTAESPQIKKVGGGIRHPVLVAPVIQGGARCTETKYNYVGTVSTPGGTVEGPEFRGAFGARCIGS